MQALLTRTTLAGALTLALAAPGIAQTGAAGQTQGTPSTQSQGTDQTPANRTPSDRDDKSNAATSSRNVADESMVSPTDRQFMMEAAMGGLMEVQLAQIAQKKAESDEVKKLAEHIEKEHTKANQELKTIAEQRGVELPTTLDAKHQAKIDKLSRLSGAEFDKAYSKEMVKDHKKDVSKFEKASRNVMDTSLREFADKTLPNLREHLQMAQTSQSSSGTRARTADQSSATQSTTDSQSNTGTQSSTPSGTADPSKDNQQKQQEPKP
jgi:putative membrane protein